MKKIYYLLEILVYGKTFLSNCIAREVLRNKKTVLYQTAPNLMDNIVSYRFGNKDLKDFYRLVDANGEDVLSARDLPIIERYAENKENNKITKTLISSNLSLQSIFNTYDERIISRIMGYYNKCRFFGDDLRLKK